MKEFLRKNSYLCILFVSFNITKVMFARLVIIFVFLCHYQAHGASLTGFIVDSETNEPLFGVALISHDKTLAFSDDEGRFSLPLEKLQSQDIVLFRHLSYHDKAVVLSRLHTDTVVRMENRFFSLSAVTITPINHQNLIKSIRTKYEKSAPAQPYWTKIHQTQSLTYRGESAGYVEYTGNMLCMGRDVTNPFIENKWLPEHIRRTKENPTVSLMMGDENRVRFSEKSINNLWLEYRFFDIVHPLGKYHKCYAFRVDSSFTVDGKDYWALSYRQKERIVVVGWSLNNISGQMWIEKNTNTLARLTGSCNQSDTYVTQVGIHYGTFDNKVVPRELSISVLYNKHIRGRRLQDKILYESRISFVEADNRKQKKKYKGDYNNVLSELIVPELPFDPEYWLQFPMSEKMDFSKDAKLPIYRDNNDAVIHIEPEYRWIFPINDTMDFTEGAKQPIFRDTNDATLQEFQIWTKKGQQQMKNEMEQLTWKKIQPVQ